MFLVEFIALNLEEFTTYHMFYSFKHNYNNIILKNSISLACHKIKTIVSMNR